MDWVCVGVRVRTWTLSPNPPPCTLSMWYYPISHTLCYRVTNRVALRPGRRGVVELGCRLSCTGGVPGYTTTTTKKYPSNLVFLRVK